MARNTGNVQAPLVSNRETQGYSRQAAIRTTTSQALKSGDQTLALAEADFRQNWEDRFAFESSSFAHGHGASDVAEEADEPIDPDLLDPLDDEDPDDRDDLGLERPVRADDPRWWDLDRPGGPFVFAIQGTESTIVRCEHLAKAWITDPDELPGLKDSKQAVHKTLNTLAGCLQEKLGKFLSHPSAANFAKDWADATDFHGENKPFPLRLPWRAKTFAEVICVKQISESELSRLKENLLLAWPKWTMELGAFWSDQAFRWELATALLAEYGGRANWDVPGSDEYKEKLAAERKKFGAMNKADKDRSWTLCRDGYHMRVMLEERERILFHEPVAILSLEECGVSK